MIEKRLIQLVAERFRNRDYCIAVVYSMETDKQREELINFIQSNDNLKWSDVEYEMLKIQGIIKR